MQTILPYIQIALSIILIVSILLQRSEAGLGAGFGSDSMSSARYARRGFEKTLFNLTIIVATLFAVVSFASLFSRT